MFFVCFRGSPDAARSWRQGLDERARSRQSTLSVRRFPMPDGAALEIGWVARRDIDLEQALPQDETRVSARTCGAGSGQVSIDLDTGAITLCAPVTSPEQLHYALRADGLSVSNDCRLLLPPGGLALDAAAVYAILQYGAIPAPLSIYRDAKRIPPGQSITFMPDGQAHARPYVWDPGNTMVESDAAAAEVRGRLRSVLPAPGAAPIALLFSGGVDSTLIADQLARDGHKDVVLVNYAFAPDDPESAIASEIATYFGFPFVRFEHDDSSVGQVLARLGDDYAYPFGDVSTLPTNAMIHAASGRVAPESVVVEGTGADAAFGLKSRLDLWRRFAAAPAAVHDLGAAAYARLGLWRSGGNLRKTCWVLRSLAQMPLVDAAVLAQNALEGIAYRIPADARVKIDAALEESYREPLKEFDFETTAGMANLMHRCSGYCAAKSFDPLRTNGFGVLYPYLSSPMVDLSALMPDDCKYREGSNKYILKAMLKQSLPPGLIDRPKTGFEPPMERLLRLPALLSCLHDIVLSPRNPVLDYVDVATTRQMIDYSAQHDLTNREVHNYLWALTFLSVWVGSRA